MTSTSPWSGASRSAKSTLRAESPAPGGPDGVRDAERPPARLFGAIPAELFQGRHDGTVFGALAVAGQLGAGAGPWVAALIHDRAGSDMAAFALAIGLSLLSVLAMWRAAPGRGRAGAGRVARPRVLA